MTEAAELVIIGAGQAGLSLSHELSGAGIEHLVLDRGRVAQSWRGRWDSFCLVLSNWTVGLPGGAYQGDDPDGFMPRDDIVGHLASYAASFQAPVREGMNVSGLEGRADGGFLLRTDASEIHAREVVIATGAYQKPYRPAAMSEFSDSLHVIDAEGYTNPGALPHGPVLVVGSGQTGCQLAEEIFGAGRNVYLACGRAPWVPRRIEGRDIATWLTETPFMEATAADLPSPTARLGANPQASGGRGGHDLNYRTLQAMGVHLRGHLVGVEGSRAHFASDLAESVAFGDARYADICKLIRNSCAARGVPAPEMPPPPPFAANSPNTLELSGLGAVICTSGYRPEYASWVSFPDAFDEMGFPIQQDGSSRIVPGLHFMGVPFQRKRKSASLEGVGEDATVLAERIVARRRTTTR